MYIKNSIDEKLYSAELYKITHMWHKTMTWVSNSLREQPNMSGAGSSGGGTL